MALTKPTMLVNIISTIGTTVQERGLTTDQFKAKFDETVAAIKAYLADVLTVELDALIATFATLTGAQTLTNKTFTSPKINENVALTATATELNYVDGVTSPIQTQIDAKAPTASPTFTGTVTAPTNTDYTVRQVRNVVLSTSDPSGGSNGDIWLKYTP